MSCQPPRVTSGPSNSGHKQIHISKLFSYIYQPSVKSIWEGKKEERKKGRYGYLYIALLDDVAVLHLSVLRQELQAPQVLRTLPTSSTQTQHTAFSLSASTWTATGRDVLLTAELLQGVMYILQLNSYMVWCTAYSWTATGCDALLMAEQLQGVMYCLQLNCYKVWCTVELFQGMMYCLQLNCYRVCCTAYSWTATGCDVLFTAELLQGVMYCLQLNCYRVCTAYSWTATGCDVLLTAKLLQGVMDCLQLNCYRVWCTSHSWTAKGCDVLLTAELLHGVMHFSQLNC